MERSSLLYFELQLSLFAFDSFQYIFMFPTASKCEVLNIRYFQRFVTGIEMWIYMPDRIGIGLSIKTCRLI